MSLFDFVFGSTSKDGDSSGPRVQSKKIESLEKATAELRETIVELEKRLHETQMIVQYIAQANEALATDMATIYESLQSVVGHFSEDPLAKWGLKSWGDDDDDDDEGNGGGWIN